MKRELSFYEVDGKYGWDQDDFPGFLMKMGGCAAVTACDSCIYFARYFGLKDLYPYDSANVLRNDYIRFAHEMEPYLHPRMGGINRVQLYIDSFGEYLKKKACTAVKMDPFEGTESAADAEKAIKKQIDQGFPIPYLLLLHKDKNLKDYNWHWFTLNGYRSEETGSFLVRAVSYGKAVWMDLENLWDTGHENKGGMVLFTLLSANAGADCAESV